MCAKSLQSCQTLCHPLDGSSPGFSVLGILWWLSSKESACKAGDIRDMGSTPGSGRSPGGGHGNQLQHSFLENAMDREAWRATIHWVAKCRT